jgi:hypothetical protein
MLQCFKAANTLDANERHDDRGIGDIYGVNVSKANKIKFVNDFQVPVIFRRVLKLINPFMVSCGIKV